MKDVITERQLVRVTELLGAGAVDGGPLNEFMQGESGRVIPRHAVDVDKKLLPLKGHVKVCIFYYVSVTCGYIINTLHS